jgi:hypothetical protein
MLRGADLRLGRALELERMVAARVHANAG